MADNLNSPSLRSIRTVEEEGCIHQSRMDQPNSCLVPVAADDDTQTKTTYMDADLYTAASKGNISKLEQMLEACDLGLQLTPKRNTILHIAAQFGQLGCVTRILQLPSSSSLLGQSNLKGDTPLCLAAREGHLRVVELLIQAAKALPDESGVGVDKAILRMTNEGKDTALHEAVRYHHPKVVKLLIEKDPQFTYGPNISGGTPLYMAAERGHADLVQIIINTSTSPAYSGISGRTALHSSVIRNNQEITAKLLEWKPSLTKVVDENGWSPLHCGAYFGYTTIVKQLLDKTSDKSVAYLGIKDGKKTALHIAASRGHKEIVDLLLSYFPDCCEQVDDKGHNVLHHAVMYKRDGYPGMLLQNDGLQVRGLINERDAQGNTPLHLLAAFLTDDEKFVSDNKVDKMGLNNENLTHKDILSRPTSYWLRKRLVLRFFNRSKESGIGPLSWLPGDSSESKDDKDKIISAWNRIRETHLIAAALVATVTFAAGFTLPGGYNENDGTATLSKKAAFKAFVVTDTLAMVFSVSATLVYFRSAGYKNEDLPEYLVWGIGLTMFGMSSMVVAFMTGMYAVLPHFSGLPILVCVLCCCFFLFFYYLFKQRRKILRR